MNLIDCDVGDVIRVDWTGGNTVTFVIIDFFDEYPSHDNGFCDVVKSCRVVFLSVGGFVSRSMILRNGATFDTSSDRFEGASKIYKNGELVEIDGGAVTQ